MATVALLLSLYLPFTIEDAPGDMIAALIIMHIVAGVVGVGVMTRLARQ